MGLKELLFGRPLPNTASEHERVGPLAGVPVLGLDALASASYGPEAALTVLLPLGAVGLQHVVPLSLCIVALLAIVQFSYRQTIAAYPSGGGSYTVARENLGSGAGLLGAAALVLDYLLNVAVAISAGVGALVSAIPQLLPHTVVLCLFLVGLLMLINLRGVRATGWAFSLPTYLFVGCFLGTFAFGLYQVAVAGGHPVPVSPPPPLVPGVTAGVGVWILLRAFSAGCTAMTGVEAVSNAVPIFREPRVRNAQRTLALIITLLSLLLLGGAVLARAYQVGATPAGEPGYQSVLSQLLGAVAGRGVFYFVCMGALMSVLCLSANTSFADFPRLCRALALDQYLPEVFAHSGRRLVYSTGIVALSLMASLLLIAFRGLTENLVHLFAIGAFLAFTTSQAGMVMHWRRVGGPHARRFMWINGIGATVTGVTLAVVLVSKFTEGAWLTLVIIPTLLLLFQRTHSLYSKVERSIVAAEPLDVGPVLPPLVVIPLKRLDRVTRKGLRFALSISPDVRAVQVRGLQPMLDRLEDSWKERVEEPARQDGYPAPRLVVLSSEFRELVDPLLDYVRGLAARNPGRFIAVLIPELIERRWYHFLLHSHTATLLKMELLFRGGPQVVIINTPWFVREPRRRRPRG